MSKKRIKQYLMLLTVVGLVAISAGGGSGTFATFNAEVTNAGNTFAAGTLFLHDNGGATTCTSESASDNLATNNCDVLFSFGTTTANNFDGGAQTADLTLTNAGTIAASDVEFKVGSCVWAVANAGGSATTFGSAPADCAGLYLTIQETDNTFASNVYCAYGTDTAGTCDAPSNSFTLDGPTALTTLLTTGAATADFTAFGGATDTRYYVITVDPSGLPTDNTMQNRKVTFSLTWHIDQ
jgi:hypothetical protein